MNLHEADRLLDRLALDNIRVHDPSIRSLKIDISSERQQEFNIWWTRYEATDKPNNCSCWRRLKNACEDVADRKI